VDWHRGRIRTQPKLAREAHRGGPLSRGRAPAPLSRGRMPAPDGCRCAGSKPREREGEAGQGEDERRDG
jgi:hypothetical protein